MFVFITFCVLVVNLFIQDDHFECDGAFALSGLRPRVFCIEQNVARVENPTRQELRQPGRTVNNPENIFTRCGPTSLWLPDGEPLPESSVGEEPALGGPTQPGGLSWKTQLHDGTQPSVRPGEDNSTQ